MIDLKEKEVASLDDFKRFDVNNWDDFCRRINWRVENTKNFNLREDAEDIIHINSMDLTLIFVVSEISKATEESSIRRILYYPIKKQDIEKFEVPESAVYESAKINMQTNGHRRIMKFSEYSMASNTLFPLMKMPEQQGLLGMVSSEDSNMFIQEKDSLNHDNILTITNKYRTNGASYMFDQNTLDEIAERMADSYYIAPISTDFLICIKEKYLCDNGNKDINEAEDDLLDMVFSFNDKAPEDKILSYRIYHYFREEQKLLSIKQQL